MSDEEEYLSDKFLAAAAAPSTTKPLTYAERRRQAQREAEIKNVQNRKKSKREIEEDSRREGLSKSLFERANEDEQTGAGQGSKAMAMMLKMGFKPGESLGRVEEPDPKMEEEVPDAAPGWSTSAKPSGHLVEPLPLDVWSGRQGVGKRKRAVSPTVAGKLAKVVQQSEEEKAHGSYRERARQEYEERRAEGRLVAATQTCMTLDEKAGLDFNVFLLNPQDPETFPPDLLESLTSDPRDAEDNLSTAPGSSTLNDRLRRQMQADALQPLTELEDDVLPQPSLTKLKDRFPPETVEEARVFIRMTARSRLELVLTYLRDKYFYCFWCGTQYADLADIQSSCPGADEDDHD